MYIKCPECASEIKVEPHGFRVNAYVGTCTNQKCKWESVSLCNDAEFRGAKKEKTCK